MKDFTSIGTILRITIKTANECMKNRIDAAILSLKSIGVDPQIINLTEVDYNQFIKEFDLYIKNVVDNADYKIDKLQCYNGVEIDCILPDIDEASNPLLSESYIAGAGILETRLFNLDSLEEIYLH